MIIRMLSDFVRGQVPVGERGGERGGEERGWRELHLDAEQAVQILGRLPKDSGEGGLINLENTDLSMFRLSGLDLSGVDFFCADLSGATLWGTDLSGANLFRVNLFLGVLFGANVSGAYLWETNLSGVSLLSVRNMDSRELSAMRYYEGFPPSLPEGLSLPVEERNLIKPGDWDYDEREVRALQDGVV